MRMFQSGFRAVNNRAHHFYRHPSRFLEIWPMNRLQRFGTGIALNRGVKANFGGSGMHSLVIWPVLTVLAGATACLPAVEDAGHRALLSWLILPSLVIGLLAMRRFGAL